METQENTRDCSGTGISPGLAMGNAFVHTDIVEQDIRTEPIDDEQVDVERRRLEKALDEVMEDLSTSAEKVENTIGRSMADIMRAHLEILRDPLLSEELRRKVEEDQIDAESALRAVFTDWKWKFEKSSSQILRKRATDIEDVSRRVLKALRGIQQNTLEQMDPDSILIAQELFPSDVAFFSPNPPRAVVLGRGTPGSHTTILIRELGIPAVVQASRITEKADNDDLLLVDGNRGEITVQPGESTRKAFRQRMDDFEQARVAARKRSHEPAVTQNGVKVPVMANVGNRHDARLAAENGADGIGMFRTEVLFATRQELPDEDELYEDTAHVVAPVEDGLCCIRLLDAGGQKEIPSINITRSSNPVLGLRGVRLLLEHRELLRMQLKSLLRLSRDRDIQIMVPMVTLPEDMKQIHEELQTTAQEFGMRDVPPLIALIETPAAALSAGEIMQHADGLSVGTNDLTQYTLAVGRDNPKVANYFQDNHPVILRLLQTIISEAGDCPVSVCGELAGRQDSTEELLQAGIRTLSVPPALIPFTKESVRKAETGCQGNSINPKT